MKIAQIAPIIERVPPVKYGGTERVVHDLTEELVRKGHEVTLFASGNSLTSARLISVYPKALRGAKCKDLYGINVISMLNIGVAYQMQDEFDIIHDHNGNLSLPLANIARRPVVITYHGQFTPEIRRLFQALHNPHVISISKSQVEGIKGINLLGNVYNGLTMDEFSFSGGHDGYLLFVGRISMEKGVHHAIETALRLNLRLIIAAKLDEIDIPYFNQYIATRLSKNIKWIGEVNEKQRNKLMSRALCFLHPVTCKEPFGLTLIEAMACGCPVVAFGKGSIPEIIVNKKTGFIAEDINEMIEGVKKVSRINRSECRRHALKNFSAKIMAEEYEKAYQKVIEKKENKQKTIIDLLHLRPNIHGLFKNLNSSCLF